MFQVGSLFDNSDLYYAFPLTGCFEIIQDAPENVLEVGNQIDP